MPRNPTKVSGTWRPSMKEALRVLRAEGQAAGVDKTSILSQAVHEIVASYCEEFGIIPGPNDLITALGAAGNDLVQSLEPEWALERQRLSGGH